MLPSHTSIVAEIGVNHNGKVDQAIKLIEVAISAGCDFVKFQAWQKNRWADIEHLRLTRKQLEVLFRYCKHRGIGWFCTPFDKESIDFLAGCGMGVWKIPSGLNNSLGFLELIAEQVWNTENQIVFSTGLLNDSEVFDYAWWLVHENHLSIKQVIILHCVTAYPTSYDQVNLKAMVVDNFAYGISDHTRGIEVPIAAVALGARMVEKHITLSRDQDGPDHRASIEPLELCQMVSAIRNVEAALGNGVKRVVGQEAEIKDRIRERMA